MFQSKVPIEERTVGVVCCDETKVQVGFNVIAAGRETYLLDMDGRVVHEWRSKRATFVAYLLTDGNLLRDGSENDLVSRLKARLKA
jgi:hypothetical protein